MVVLGIMALADQDEIRYFVHAWVPTTMIILGLLAIAISFTGYIGSLRESPRLLKVYFTSLLVLVIVQIVLASTALSYHRQMDSWMREIWKSSSDQVRMNIERNLKCCGFYHVNDFASPLDCSKNPEFGYRSSCNAKLVRMAHQYSKSLAVSALVVGILEVVGLAFSAILFYNLRDYLYSREGSLLEESRALNREGAIPSYQSARI
jgi:small-conductance mechanosensitive channel